MFSYVSIEWLTRSVYVTVKLLICCIIICCSWDISSLDCCQWLHIRFHIDLIRSSEWLFFKSSITDFSSNFLSDFFYSSHWMRYTTKIFLYFCSSSVQAKLSPGNVCFKLTDFVFFCVCIKPFEDKARDGSSQVLHTAVVCIRTTCGQDISHSSLDYFFRKNQGWMLLLLSGVISHNIFRIEIILSFYFERKTNLWLSVSRWDIPFIIS